MTDSRFTQLKLDALNGLNATAPVMLECLDEIDRLQRDIQAYRDALGDSVPRDHNGKMTVPIAPKP